MYTSLLVSEWPSASALNKTKNSNNGNNNNKSIYHLLRTYYVSVTVLSTFHTLPNLIVMLPNLISHEIGLVILIL